jgi:hypothetical protein
LSWYGRSICQCNEARSNRLFVATHLMISSRLELRCSLVHTPWTSLLKKRNDHQGGLFCYPSFSPWDKIYMAFTSTCGRFFYFLFMEASKYSKSLTAFYLIMMSESFNWPSHRIFLQSTRHQRHHISCSLFTLNYFYWYALPD